MLLASSAFAHPGANVNKDIMRRKAHLEHPDRRTVAHCKRDLEESGWVREQAMRRAAKLQELREAAGFGHLHKRDPEASPEAIEAEFGKSAACTLDPEATEGPYCKLWMDEMSTVY